MADEEPKAIPDPEVPEGKVLLAPVDIKDAVFEVLRVAHHLSFEAKPLWDQVIVDGWLPGGGEGPTGPPGPIGPEGPEGPEGPQGIPGPDDVLAGRPVAYNQPVDRQVLAWHDDNGQWEPTESVLVLQRYVEKAGDTMTGDLWVTNPTDPNPVNGLAHIRISGSQDGAGRIRFRKNDVGQWMIDTDETHYRIINYTPDGAAKGVPFNIEPDNRILMIRPQCGRNPTDPDDLVRQGWTQTGLDEKVNRAGDTMTGLLETPAIQIINPSDAIIRLSGPHSAVVSFRRGGLALEPQWWFGTQYDVGQGHANNLCVVRFTVPGDIQNGDIPFEIDYASGATIGGRFITRNLTPTTPDELTSREYVDAIAGLYLPLTGGILTGPLTLTADIAQLSVNGINGSFIATHGSDGTDWFTGSGGVLGTFDYGIAAVRDGNRQHVPLRINRATGATTLLDVNGGRFITNAGDPTDPDELCRKQYVDDLFATGPPPVTQELIGVINARTGLCRYIPGTGHIDGPLIDPADTHPGAYLICDEAGNIPEPLQIGDWLITEGTVWIRLAIGDAAVTASGVSVIPPVLGTDNVQDALEALVDYRRVHPWTPGVRYEVNETVYYDNRLFVVLTLIDNAPATPDFATIRPLGYGQSDYWSGNVVTTNWAVGNWVHICTVPAYGTYRVQISDLHSGQDTALMVDIVTAWNTATATITGYSHQGTGTWSTLRLSATGNGQPVRLELQLAAITGTPNFKIVVHGESRGIVVNQVAIQKPPPALANGATLGGTQRAIMHNLQHTNLGSAGDIDLDGRLKFYHANLTDINDGTISVRRHSAGLNLVGASTETTGETGRQISMYGEVRLRGTTDRFISPRGVECTADNWGYATNGGGWFYKKTGSGMTIRCHTANTQPRIENNDGTNGRDIIDTTNGDARYVRTGANSQMTGNLDMRQAGRFRWTADTNNAREGAVFTTFDNAGRAGWEFIHRQSGGIVGGNPEVQFQLNTMNGGFGWQEVFHTVVGSPPYVDFRARPRVNNVPVLDEIESDDRYLSRATGARATSAQFDITDLKLDSTLSRLMWSTSFALPRTGNSRVLITAYLNFYTTAEGLYRMVVRPGATTGREKYFSINAPPGNDVNGGHAVALAVDVTGNNPLLQLYIRRASGPGDIFVVGTGGGVAGDVISTVTVMDLGPR